jgi:hypothetical protein
MIFSRFARSSRLATTVLVFVFAGAVVSAAPLSFVQQPDGSGLYSVLVNDAFAGTGSANGDEWSFEGEIGDLVSVRLEMAIATANVRVRILNATGTTLASHNSGSDGVGLLYSYRITTPGTYRVFVYTDSSSLANYTYAMRIDLARGPSLEVEANDSVATANLIVPKMGASAFTFAAGGLVPANDTGGDYYSLGLAPAGTSLSIDLKRPAATAGNPSSLTPADLSLRLFEQPLTDRGLDFDGSKYVTIPHNAVFDSIETNNRMTIEGWVYVRSYPSGWFTLLNKYEATGDWGWEFDIENNGNGLQLWNDTNSRVVTGILPAPNTWHHIAVAYDHSANQVRFYLNGALVATRVSPGPLKDTDGEPAYIGFSPAGGDEYSNGIISELKVWNRALTTEEIQAHYAASHPFVASQVWNPATEYHTGANPNGVWTYGQMSLDFATFTPYTNKVAYSWFGSNVGNQTPHVAFNTSSNSLTLHPGSGAVPTSLRWTAPAGVPATVKVKGEFLAGDSGVMQVGVRKGATVLWSASNAGAFDLDVNVVAGDTLDFVVYGGYDSGTTPLQLTITGASGISLPAPNQNGLVGLWKFDEGSGTVAADTSASGNNAVLGGGDSSRVPAWRAGMVRTAAPVSGTTLNRTFTTDSSVWLQLSASANRGLSARYLLTGTMTDSGALQVVATTLPNAGGTTTEYIQGFNLTFNDELDPVSANNLTNFELRGAGKDTLFGTSDDIVYTLGAPNYTNGTLLTFALVNGPLQPGKVRFTIGLGLRDRFGNFMSGNFVREFTSEVLNGYLPENQSNNTLATATSLAASGGEGAGPGFTWRGGVEFEAGNNPSGLALADFDSDGKLDAVTANYNGGNIGVMKGNGDGTFGTATTYAAPNQPFHLAVGDLNGDTKPDVVVTRLNGSAVMVFLNKNDGTGSLHPGVNYATAAQPHRLVLADLNGDGRLDIATANRSSNSVSVLYGNGTVPGVGDGTFAAKVDFAVAGGPYSIAAGHLNGDSLMDLVVGTGDDRSVKVLYRQAADGSYPVGETFAWGTREVMAVAVGDLNADTRADIVAVQEYGTNVRRWHQQAGGGFVEGPTLNFGENTYEYSLAVQDLNGDGRLDVITGGYYYFTVFENLGGGAFASPVTPGGGNSHVHQIAVGDLNGDNRLDLVGAMYNKTTLRVFLGRGPETLPVDGAGFLGKARGNLSADNDVDAFSFSAKAGDRVFVTSESFPRANSTGLLYRIYRPEGGEYTNFYGNANPSNGNDGTGQTQFVAPVSGVYYVRAEQWHGYRGEYRIAVAVHAGTYDLESESNNQANQADALNWSQEAGPRTASVGGIINFGDPGGLVPTGLSGRRHADYAERQQTCAEWSDLDTGGDEQLRWSGDQRGGGRGSAAIHDPGGQRGNLSRSDSGEQRGGHVCTVPAGADPGRRAEADHHGVDAAGGGQFGDQFLWGFHVGLLGDAPGADRQ